MLLEELGALLHPGFEFRTGKQHTHVQNRTRAVLPAGTGRRITARELS